MCQITKINTIAASINFVFFMFSVSLFTLQRSRAFVDALFNLMGPLSLSDIRFSALLAQNISGVANNQACYR